MAKGMSTALRVTVAAVVILVVAVVVLTIFVGGIENVAAFINAWFKGGDPCEAMCEAYCTMNPDAEPKPYKEFFGCSESDKPCIC